MIQELIYVLTYDFDFSAYKQPNSQSTGFFPSSNQLYQQVGEELRVSKEDVRRASSMLSDLESEKAGMIRQSESDADVTAERVHAAGQRITELQGKQNNAMCYV